MSLASSSPEPSPFDQSDTQSETEAASHTKSRSITPDQRRSPMAGEEPVAVKADDRPASASALADDSSSPFVSPLAQPKDTNNPLISVLVQRTSADETHGKQWNEHDANGESLATNVTNPLTFVPADALKRTRKGATVGASEKENLEDQSMFASSDKTSPSEGSHAKRNYTYDDLSEEANSVDTVNLLPASAWTEVDVTLSRFKSIPTQSNSEKGSLLRTILLPFLALEAETPDVEVSGTGPFCSGKKRRQLFFDWVHQLIVELQSTQTSADRGAILESIACIVESRNFSALVLNADEADEEVYYTILGRIIEYAIGELNKKGVYQNTLIFSGRLLAVAFFRLKGVASKLLRSLPVNRFALERIATDADWANCQPANFEEYRQRFPSYLQDFCMRDARSYLKVFDDSSLQADDDDRYLVRQTQVVVEMSGNWLRRWQSDDSELFFSFCRSYHRQLASLFANQRPLLHMTDRKLFFGAPGYSHLATCIHQKCLSLVHRDILSVTTLSSQKNFNPGETANVLSGSTAGKPRHLEAANRRCTAIVVDIIRTMPSSGRGSIFSPMLNVHVKCLVGRTSLYDVQGVFCLLDWLDGVLSHMENAELPIGTFIDIDFLLHTIWLLFRDADHALALMRTIAVS